MPFEPLLRFVVEFVRVLRVQVEAQRVVDIRVARVVDKPVEVQVAVRVRVEQVPLWVVPLSLRRVPH